MSDTAQGTHPAPDIGVFRTVVAFIAFAGIVAIIVITLGDIALRVLNWTGWGSAFNLPRSVPGVLDMVEFAQVVAAQFSIAFGFAMGAHVCVDVLSMHFSRRTAMMSVIANGVISAAFLALCVHQTFVQLASQYSSTQVSATLGWPLWWYWCPTFAGLTLALIASIARSAHELRSRQNRS